MREGSYCRHVELTREENDKAKIRNCTEERIGVKRERRRNK